MKTFIGTSFAITLFYLAAFSPALAAKIETMPTNPSGNGPTEHCAISVEFGSYSDGIDKNVFSKIESYVETTSIITEAHLYAWGHEGEQTLCLTTDSDDAAVTAYTNIKTLMPTQPAHGSITVTKGAESFSVP